MVWLVIWRNSGTLQDGTHYLIYRFILYHDGFKQKKSLSDQRSVSGCYILPAELPHNCRCSSTSVRTITLGGHGQDTNSILDHIVDDIFNGTVQGIDAINPKREIVKIFLDSFANIGDYPAVTTNADLSGHTSDMFCSFCTIRRCKGTNSSEILYYTHLHNSPRSHMG